MYVSNAARATVFLLAVLSATAAEAAAVLVSSTFDADREDWTASGDVASIIPVYLASGGNPGGTIEVDDQTLGGVWYYDAPAKFLGDKSLAYRQDFTFDLYQRGSGPQFEASDVVLNGAGLTLTIDAGPNPLPLETWQSYSVRFEQGTGWKKVTNHVSLSGPDATQDELLAVLADLDRLRVRGEFITGSDFGRIDNVIMNVVPVPAALPLLGSALLGLAGIGFARSRF